MTRPLAPVLAAMACLVPFVAAGDCPDTERASLPAGAVPRIELVFALDATGSMGGLIEGAKNKIWSIVNAAAAANPEPELRIGLLVYRDRGDEYVTRSTPLSSELDRVYAWLIDQRAGGGGDTPEGVRQALYEAVASFDWSDDPGTLRLLFLVGDAPPHEDETDTPALEQAIALAASRGIVINTVQCGDMPDTARVWQAVAKAAGGDYFRVEQSGGMQSRSTPFDAELARHARLLDQTVVPYGGADERDETLRRIEEGASDEALAERARFKAGESGPADPTDLVRRVLSGELTPSRVERGRLPEPLRSMTDDELQSWLEMLAERRRGLREELQWFAEQRERVLAAERGADADGFDRRVVQSLECQGKRIGLRFD